MAWIESHVEIGEHPKVYGLSTTLNVRKAEAVGLLHLLWHFTMKFAWRDGDISRFSYVIIARSCGWENDPDTLIEALISNGFLDNGNCLKVHDWQDFAGRLVNDRIYNEKRRRKTSVERRQTSVNGALPTLPTLPTIPTVPTNKYAFDEIWSKYPIKDGKRLAERSFRSSVKTDKDWDDINRALSNYLKSERVTKGYIKNGSTWFNNWRDWVEFSSVDTDSIKKAQLLEAIEKDKKKMESIHAIINSK